MTAVWVAFWCGVFCGSLGAVGVLGIIASYAGRNNNARL